MGRRKKRLGKEATNQGAKLVAAMVLLIHTLV